MCYVVLVIGMIIRGNVTGLCKQYHLAWVKFKCKCKIAFGERLTTFLQIFLRCPSDPEARDNAKCRGNQVCGKSED